MTKAMDLIGKAGLVPVIAIDDANDAPAAAKALLTGGLPIMEITMRTDAGLEAIRYVKETYPQILVGAGTVLNIEKARESVEAGAEFIVSPGFNPEIVKWCLDNKIDITPGCVTPTEIEKAMSFDLNILKFFPASIYGGIKGLKSLAGPYRMIKFIPTGGINDDNLTDYADKPFIHAIGGGWLCSSSDIRSHNFKNITSVVKKAIDILLGFELAHIGINAKDSDKALHAAKDFSKMFNFSLKEGNSSIFAGQEIEVNRKKAPGLSGHIAIRTNSIERAAYYLGNRGFQVDWSTAKEKDKKMIAVYLKDEIGGFAIHLLQK